MLRAAVCAAGSGKSDVRLTAGEIARGIAQTSLDLLLLPEHAAEFEDADLNRVTNGTTMSVSARTAPRSSLWKSAAVRERLRRRSSPHQRRFFTQESVKRAVAGIPVTSTISEADRLLSRRRVLVILALVFLLYRICQENADETVGLEFRLAGNVGRAQFTTAAKITRRSGSS